MTLSDQKQRLLQARMVKAKLLTGSHRDKGDTRLRKHESSGPVPLSSAQQRMWYQSQFADASAYNFCIVLRVQEVTAETTMSLSDLKIALHRVVQRHDILRTRYVIGSDGVALQVVDDTLRVDATLHDLSSATPDQELEDLALELRSKAFDLSCDVSLRGALVRRDDKPYAVVLTLPHIAGDGGSFGTVLRDLKAAFDAPADVMGARDQLQYGDYAVWEQKRLNETDLSANQLGYWSDTLENLPDGDQFPADFARPEISSFRGQQVRQWLGQQLSADLRHFAKARGMSSLVLMQTAVSAVLKNSGGGEDICLGVPVDLRQDSGLSDTVGFFNNTVAIRCDLGGNPTLQVLLERVHTRMLDALDHRDVPFETVVERVNPVRQAARNPLFDVMVTTSRPWPDMEFSGARWVVEEPRQTQAKFDLTFVLHDEGGQGRIGLSLLFACDLYSEQTAANLVSQLTATLGQMIYCTDTPLSEVQYIVESPFSEIALSGLSKRSSDIPEHRQIALRDDVKDHEIRRALIRLIARNPALRLIHDPELRGWRVLETAELFEGLSGALEQSKAASNDRFLAWVAEDKNLIVSAPAGLLDPESWALVLSELADIRQNAEVSQSTASASYDTWLTRTVELGQSEAVLDLAEDWLDLLETHASQPNETDGQEPFLENMVLELSDIPNHPDPRDLRRVAVAALMPMLTQPCRLDIDEPDRDRFAQEDGGFYVIGKCRRYVPTVLNPASRGESDPLPAEMLELSDTALSLPDDRFLTGNIAVSYQMARDIHSETAGAFDHLPDPQMVLSVRLSDWGDVAFVPPTHPEMSDQVTWLGIDVCAHSKRVCFSLKTCDMSHDAKVFLQKWAKNFATLATNITAVPACSASRASEGALALSAWERRKIEDEFGAIKGVFSLSPLQEGLRFHAAGTSQNTSDVYISQTTLSLSGEIDPRRLQRAIDRAAALVPNITAGFSEIGGKPVQVCPHSIRIPFAHMNVATEADAQVLADAEYNATFDIAKPPLIRMALATCVAPEGGTTTHKFYLTAHHILLDGWSIRLLCRLIFQMYSTPDADITPPSIGRYLSWLEQQDPEASQEPWRALLSGAQPTLLYPAAQGLEATVTHSAEQEAHIPVSAMKALSDLARDASTTLSSVLELAWGLLLIRMSGNPDVVFGTVVSGRPAGIEGVDEMIGLIFNTVPSRIHAHEGETVRQALSSLHDQKAASLSNAHVPLSQLMQISGHNPLFDTLFAIQNLPPMTLDHSSDVAFGQATVRDATHYPLSLAVSPSQNGITVRLMYRSDLIEGNYASDLLSAYQHILNECIAQPDKAILHIDALANSLARLPQTDSGNVLEYGNASVSDLLIAQAEKSPDLRAVVAGDVELSFAELSQQANQLARFLQMRGVHPEHKVALLLPRSEKMIVALFGVFAAHSAYVPIDAETPAKRIEAILDQAEPTVILTTGDMRHLLPDSYQADYRVVEFDAPEVAAVLESLPTTCPDVYRPAGSDHLAYVIFTSGSTGKPKGVEVPYRGLTNMFVNHQKEIFAPTLASQGGRRIRIAHTTSFAFDASWEQLLWLLSGHEVYVISDELRRDPDRLLELFDAAEIDAFDVTPTYGSYLVEHGLLERPRPKGDVGTGVVFVSLGGEAVGDALWDQLRDAPGVGGYNLYGPTEYTINALGADLADSAEPSVGRPISNTRALILGPGLLPAPIGVTGELYLSGVGLARGYIQRSGLTAERFVAHPCGAPGERMYRTGDLARWREDGSIDFLGRADSQLKIRGYRIEPAEIENVIVSINGISRAAVVGRKSDADALQLVAYIVATQDPPAIAALRDQLRAELPSYMIPAAFVYVDDLPRTINGKLDVAALPKPEMDQTTDAPPATGMEATICAAFAEVLEVKAVGRFDDFFDLGGHSLLTVRLAGMLRDRLEAEVSVRDVYDYPTPAALAEAKDVSVQSSVVGLDMQATDTLDVDLTEASKLPSHIPLIAAGRVVLSQERPVLLTGAAGFLGCHLIAEILTTSEAKIECLVRAKDNASATARVERAMQEYGLWQDAYKDRISGLAGDLSQDLLGLTAQTFNALSDRYGVIIHNGGATNEAEPYARLAPTNVGGAEQILSLATQGERAVPIHFISTASVVAKQGVNPDIIPEATRLTATEIEPTGYVQSKWVAEEMMHNAAHAGLPVTIHRPGRISGHSRSGACGPGVGFWYFIRAMLQLGAVPDLASSDLTLAPVDYVARAIVALLEHGESGATYHITNHSQTSIGEIVAAAQRAGYPLKTVEFEAWLEDLEREANSRAARGDTSLNAAFMLTDHMKKYNGPVQESVLGQSQIKAALADTDIAPPRIDGEILDRYVAYFVNTGFFPKPTRCLT